LLFLKKWKDKTMKAIVLAGGKGTRLWPLSRQNYPKQFVEFLEGKSLFQLTLQRLLNIFKARDIFIVSGKDYKFHIFNQIDALKIPKFKKERLKNNLVLEPQPKSTLASVLIVFKYLEEEIKNELFFVFPSDHIITPLNKFKSFLKKAIKLANYGYIVIFGIKPTSPKEGYGYIMIKEKFKEGYLIKRFVEKPKGNTLRNLLKKGAFWNAGIFCFRKDVFMEEVKKYQPSLFKIYENSFSSFLKKFYKLPSLSIDCAIIEKTKRAALVKFDLEWSDLGNWINLEEFFKYEKDKNKNIVLGKAKLFFSQNCFSFSKERLIAGIGLKNTIVVDASDAILILNKKFAQKIKEVINFLKKEKEIKDSLTIYRPWGYYTILKEANNYKVKEIGIYPKKYISLQTHKFRSEHWTVVEGKLEVVLENKKTVLKKNESIYVPKKKKHRLYNPTNKVAKVIEVQLGSYLGEDDIRRFDLY